MPLPNLNFSRRHLSSAFLLTLFSAAAAAVDFAPADVQSLVGEPLFAEVLVSPAPGERIDVRCLRVVDPQEASLPVLRQASIRISDVALGDERKLMRLETRRAILDSAISVTLEADCGIGRQRRELILTLRPSATAARALDSVEHAAAKPSGNASPSNAAARPKRPQLIISAAAPAGDEPAAIPQQRRRLMGSSVDAAPRLQLSTTLGTSPVVTDTLRQALRLEYQLLLKLNEQLYAHTTANLKSSASVERAADTMPVAPVADTPLSTGSMPSMEKVAEAPPSPVVSVASVAPAPAAVPEPAPVVAAPQPLSIPKAAPDLPPPADSDDWLLPAVGGAAILLLLALFVAKRRKRPLPEVPTSPEFADTVLITHDAPARAAPANASSAEGTEGAPNGTNAANSSGAVSTQQMEAFFSTPSSSAVAPVSVAENVEEASSEPVMELAEIMLSFGRLQGAAQTLQEYIDAHPGEDLQPWVKLLEIYRGGEMRQEFEELSKRFNRNFNVEVQPWEPAVDVLLQADDVPPKALSIEEIPHIRDQIVQLWGKPECVDYLRNLLHDNRGGQRSGFRLPVVQEILFLLDIAVILES